MNKLGQFEINQIYAGDCALLMAQLPNDCIDLTVTSPPYDNLREYKGYVFAFENIARELYRVTKPGGVVVWVVADATVNGSESGTSFRQALYFMELGFNLHDTMLYKTDKPPMNDRRYQTEFEYMFVFSKGKPAVFNPITVRTKNQGGKPGSTYREVSGELKPAFHNKRTGKTKVKGNIWYYSSGGKSNGHPAPFPAKLAHDHIISWSNPGDIVLDPMCGSGTTCKMAKQNGRQFLGFEISDEYCEIARKRIQGAQPPLLLLDSESGTNNKNENETKAEIQCDFANIIFDEGAE